MTKPSPKQKVRKVKSWAVVDGNGRLVEGHITQIMSKQLRAFYNASKRFKAVRVSISYLQ